MVTKAPCQKSNPQQSFFLFSSSLPKITEFYPLMNTILCGKNLQISSAAAQTSREYCHQKLITMKISVYKNGHLREQCIGYRSASSAFSEKNV